VTALSSISSIVLIAVVSIGSIGACGSSPAPPPAATHEEEPEPDAGPEEDAASVISTIDAPERSRAPSTATYEQAMSTAEPVDIKDDHLQLSDAQLTGPMRGVLTNCRLPSNGKVTIKTAVQNGRAIGATVEVRLIKPAPPPRSRPRPPSKAAQKAEAKAIAKISACIDKNVRLVVWPPSRRRDSFTMEF
jgi:hypothetical protein